jgi:hypothetical protein
MLVIGGVSLHCIGLSYTFFDRSDLSPGMARDNEVVSYSKTTATSREVYRNTQSSATRLNYAIVEFYRTIAL